MNNYLGNPSPAFGQSIPASPHAISVSIPKTGAPVFDCMHNLGTVNYEEGHPQALQAMQSGYPRFFVSKFIQTLAAQYIDALKLNASKIVYIYPSQRIAEQAVSYAGAGGVVATKDNVYLAVLPLEEADKGKQFWQHAGLGISSRQAEDILNGATRPATDSVATLRDCLGTHYGVANKEDVLLLPSGMAAVFQAYQAVVTTRGTKTVQFGFPYADSLKIQQRFGEGSVYVPYNNPSDMDKLEAVLKKGGISAIFLEVPGNPLLRTPDLARLTELAQTYKVPVIIDDTIATVINFNALARADMVVTSLSKATSGTGDVLAGSLVLNAASPFYRELKQSLATAEQPLYERDAQRLLETAAGFAERVMKMNDNAAALAVWLRQHPMVGTVHYTDQDKNYQAAKCDGAGGGCLLSFRLKDEHVALAPAFYDALQLAKGPSLGTDFTLVCQYTLLAHYTELPQVEKMGTHADLLRVSVGIEDIGKIIKVFGNAFEAAKKAGPRTPLPWQPAYDRALKMGGRPAFCKPSK